MMEHIFRVVKEEFQDLAKDLSSPKIPTGAYLVGHP
jgi:hypothetical protein